MTAATEILKKRGCVKEFFQLLWLNVVVTKRNFVEYIKVVFRYYSNFSFMKTDISLLTHYLFKNPFRMSKHFLVKKGEEEVYAYGETPLTTLEMIAKECAITPDDTVFELGSGRGRNCFWLHHFIGCKVVGIEWVPSFVRHANSVQKEISFRHEDMFESDLSGATVIYLYGTSLSDDKIKKLSQKLSSLPPGTRIITVSYPLSDYCPEGPFEVMRLFPAKFTWGKADVYLQVIK